MISTRNEQTTMHKIPSKAMTSNLQNLEIQVLTKQAGLLFPDRSKLLCLLVVASQPVNPALNKDQPELGILVLPVPFQMFPDGNSLLDEVVQILRNFRGKTYPYKYHQNNQNIH